MSHDIFVLHKTGLTDFAGSALIPPDRAKDKDLEAKTLDNISLI